MAEGSKLSAGNPRVFLSYARSDGERFATDLRRRLQVVNIPLWQDRVSMEGGRDWWLQIVEALEQVEFMVMIMTPAALRSPIVRKEWRYARQKGVCIYPVKADSTIEFAKLPRWMREVHWYDLEHEWTKFINDLNTRCEQERVPFMVEDLPADFVERPEEFETLIKMLLDTEREEPIAITTALRGAGGFGKTTMARAVCHDERIQEAFDDGILWVTLGENPDNLIGKIEDLIYILSHERPGFTGMDAAIAYFAELLEDRDILLVIDDVWNAAHLKPFLQGGKRCARLITTRDESVLPRDATRFQLDAMKLGQAVQLLSASLTAIPPSQDDVRALSSLAARLGEWPLLLTLVNGALRERVYRGQSLKDALAYVDKALERRGLTAFDAQKALERNQAVKKTLSVSFDLLSANDHARYRELAIFPEDVDIPFETVQKLWGATGYLDDIDTEEVCQRLYGLSLLLHCDFVTHTIRLHDVIRAYLRQEVGKEELAKIHKIFLDTYQVTQWADLSLNEPYLWRYLTFHLLASNQGTVLVATVKDLRFIAAKACACGVSSVEADLQLAYEYSQSDSALIQLKRAIMRIGHLLDQCDTPQDAQSTLINRLSHIEELSHLCQICENQLARPFLKTWHSLPDIPSSALVRTLIGHKSAIWGCAVSPQGDWIVSASADQTLKIWDTQTGEERLTLRGHIDRIRDCAVSPQGDWIVSASDDRTLKIWDSKTGKERLTLEGHTDEVWACAVSPQGDWIVSASNDHTLKIWDTQTGKERLTLEGYSEDGGCAVSPQGDWVVSASDDHTLKIWDVQTGQEKITLRGHTKRVWDCAVSPQGDWIVSASDDCTLKIWDSKTGEERFTLRGHADSVRSCAISPKGDWIVSASYDKTLKVWDAQTGKERLTLQGHTDWVQDCVITSQQGWIISASGDGTLKIWGMETIRKDYSEHKHGRSIMNCAVSLDGDWVVTVAEETAKVWDMHTGKKKFTLIHGIELMGCAVSPQKDRIITVSTDSIKIWDSKARRVLFKLEDRKITLMSCAVSPRWDWIVCAASYEKRVIRPNAPLEKNVLIIWDIQKGDKRHVLAGHTGTINDCAISPLGDWIVSASLDETLRVWDVQTGEERRTLIGHQAWVMDCAISPLGDWIVSASLDETLKVWDVQTGEERRTLIGHHDSVWGCAVSPQGDLIASASADRTLKVWDAYYGRCLATFHAEGELRCCAFHPDNEHLIVGGDAGLYFLRLIR